MTTIIFFRYANFLFGYVLNFILKRQYKVLSLRDIYMCMIQIFLLFFFLFQHVIKICVCVLVRQMHVIICYCLVTMVSTNYLLKSQFVLSLFFYHL